MIRRICSLTLAALVLQPVGIVPAFAAFQEDLTIAPEQEILGDVSLPRALLALDPSASLDRASFTALAVATRYSAAEIDHCFWDIASSVPPRFTLLFRDVGVDHPLAKHLCIALRDGIIRGYGDGTFRPAARINAAEATKIITRAYSLAPFAEVTRHDPWYWPYVQSLTARNAVPRSIDRLDQSITMADLTEMKARLEGDITWRPGRSMEELVPETETKGAIGTQTSARPLPPPRRPTPSSSSTSTPTKNDSSLRQSDETGTDGTGSGVTDEQRKWWEIF